MSALASSSEKDLFGNISYCSDEITNNNMNFMLIWKYRTKLLYDTPG